MNMTDSEKRLGDDLRGKGGTAARQSAAQQEPRMTPYKFRHLFHRSWTRFNLSR
jgi:hypothetical protein